jgi:hypothetical protein
MLVTAAANAPAPALRRLFLAAAIAGLLFIAALFVVAVMAGPGDANFDYMRRYRAVFLLARFSPLPGLALAAGAVYLTLSGWRHPSAGSSP